MFKKVPIKEFRYLDIDASNIALLAADVFYIGLSRGRKAKKDTRRLKYCSDTLKALCKGMFCGLITDFAYNRAKKEIGEEAFYAFINSKIGRNSRAKCFQIKISGCLEEYETLPAYAHLFKLAEDGNMHMPNLTSIIAAIELDVPLVSDDPHFFIQQNNIIKAYRKRHREDRRQTIIDGRKTSDIEILTPRDFCKTYLR